MGMPDPRLLHAFPKLRIAVHYLSRATSHLVDTAKDTQSLKSTLQEILGATGPIECELVYAEDGEVVDQAVPGDELVILITSKEFRVH